MEHTPGKWVITEAKMPDSSWYKHIVDERGFTIALILDRTKINKKDPSYKDENEANTKLIANAPNNLLLLNESYNRLMDGRRYLMGVQANELNVEDALEAFGFNKNGLL